METQYLRTLLTILESGSFSRAATDLSITQSAVSQRVRFLEERYGLTLLNRGAVLAPTDAGRVVQKWARQILVLEKEMENELKGLGRNCRLSLCCTPTFGIVYLPRVLNRFFLANSDEIDFKFALNTPEESLKGLLENEFDLAIIEHCDELDPEGAASYRLPPDELAFISAPPIGLPQPEVSLEELLGQRIIARREGCSSRCVLQENLSRSGKRLDDFKGVIVHDDLHLTLQMVREGRGVAFVSKSLVRDEIAAGTLRWHMVPGFRSQRFRTLLVTPRRREDPVVQKFITEVLHLFDILPSTHQ